MSKGWRTWREDAGGLGAVALLAVAVWMLIVGPGEDARKQSDHLRTQTDLVNSQVAMIQAQARTAQADLAAARERAEIGFPLREPSEFNRVLAALNQAAVESNVALDQILPGAVEREPEITRFRLAIAGRGTYPAAVAFLERLRDGFPDVTVLALSASRGSEEGDATALLSLEIAWHAQPERVPPNSRD